MTEQSKDIVEIPVSFGELLDKITILQIKLDKVESPSQRQNIALELKMLEGVATGIERIDSVVDFIRELKQVNESLWSVEDDIRECEASKDSSDSFVDLARSVYVLNDQRQF